MRILYQILATKFLLLIPILLHLAKNFVLHRNLLNYYSFFIIAEVLDYGYPQKTDTGILKTYITQTGIRTQVRSVFFCYYL